MVKMAKKIQTDYTKGGRDISNTAIPYYQNTLTTLNDYTQDPYAQIDTIMDKYYSNNAMQSDFLRNYNRAMANTSANNFASTGGGYSSSGQRAYNDQQRYQNDLASRLQQYGVGQAFAGQNQLYGQALAGAGAFHNAYGLGKEYSDIDQYNNLADQNNSWTNQLAGLASGAGQVLSSIPTPWTQAIGAGLQVAGNLGSTDVSQALGTSAPSNTGWVSSIANGLAGTDWSKIGTVFSGGKANKASTDRVINSPYINTSLPTNSSNTSQPNLWGFNQSSNSSPFKMNW